MFLNRLSPPGDWNSNVNISLLVFSTLGKGTSERDIRSLGKHRLLKRKKNSVSCLVQIVWNDRDSFSFYFTDHAIRNGPLNDYCDVYRRRLPRQVCHCMLRMPLQINEGERSKGSSWIACPLIPTVITSL